MSPHSQRNSVLSKKSGRDLHKASRAAIQPLESRRMLCTSHYDPIANPAPAWSDAVEQQFQSSRGPESGPEAVSIVWANRNTLSGAGDNFFDDVFGTSLSAAQGVVDAALAAWSRVITSFNRADGTSTLQINITMNRDANNNFVGGFGGAGGPAGTAPADGKPRTGNITVNAGTIDGDPNNSNGWFLDTTPNDYSEFQGDILTPFAANQTTNIGSDLFSLVTAEVTHTLGLISAKPDVAGFEGYLLANSGFVQATGQRDNAEGGGTSGFFYVFDGPTIDHLMTGYNSGDGDSDSWGNVIHTAGGTANISFNGRTWRGTEDDGNAAYNAERLLPSHVTATILKDAYGYSIEPPAKFGSMYSVLNQTTGVITVRGADNSNDTISITRNGSLLTVAVDIQADVPGSHNAPGAFNAPAWVTEYNLSAVSSINVFPGTGDDTVLVTADMGSLPVLFNGGIGTDKLQISGGAGYDSFSTPNSSTVTTTNGQVAYSSMETLEIFTGDGDADVNLNSTNASSARVTGGSAGQTINFSFLDGGTPTIVDLGNGNDVLNFGTGAGVSPIQSPVTIFGVGGDDVINIAPSDFASTVITQPVAVFGDAGNDTMNIGSNNADSVDVNITFDGGASTGFIGDRIVFNDFAPSYNISYDVGPNVVTRDGFNLPRSITYVNTDGIVINAGSGADNVIVRNGVGVSVSAFGNSGNDNFTRGDGIITASSTANFNGGPGIDRITFDDHLSTGNVIFDCKPNEVLYGGLISQVTTGFESVGILAGTGANEITFDGILEQHFNVDAGGGNDTIKFGFLVKAELAAGVTVVGGAGNDNFLWNRSSNNWSNYGYLSGLFTNPIVLDGGSGYNTLSVDDTARTPARYDLTDTRLRVTESDFLVFGSDFGYDNMQAISITCSNNNNVLVVSGVSADIDIGNQVTINMNGGTDTAFVYPHNAAGDLTINGNIGIIGGAGTDTMTIEDAGGTQPINYAFANPFGSGTQNIYGLGARPLGTATLETWRINAGDGDDTFAMNQFTSGVGVGINAGGGNDTLQFGNNGLAAITSLAFFDFNGGADSDTFNLNNQAHTGNWTYTRNLGSITASSSLGASYFLTDSNTELMRLNGGPSGETFNINAVATGSSVEAYGAGGLDIARLTPATGNAEPIQGRVDYDAGAGGGNAVLFDQLDGTGDTFHLTQSSLGAFPGDNLFGPGGSFNFAGLTDVNIIAPALTVHLGSGSDIGYLQPLASGTATVNFNAQNFSEASKGAGDGVNLALAQAVNYVITDPGTGNGSVTSDTTGGLNWNGVELPVGIDDTAPNALSGDFAFDVPAQAVTFTFDEDVSATLTTASFILTNLTTGVELSQGVMSLASDVGTNSATVTFSGLVNGALDDGNYHAVLAPSYRDFSGNFAAAALAFDFFVFAGDANHDRSVNLDDFTALAAAFGAAGTFSQGDFDYSGSVDLDDFTILASKFGTTLPAPASLPRQATAMRVGGSGFSDRLIDELAIDELA